jgi:hypothetical protein
MRTEKQLVKTQRPGRRIRLMSWIAALAVTVCLSIAWGGQPSNDEDAVRVRRVPWVGYVSVVVENRRAYDVTVNVAIRGRNVRVAQILPETRRIHMVSATRQ